MNDPHTIFAAPEEVNSKAGGEPHSPREQSRRGTAFIPGVCESLALGDETSSSPTDVSSSVNSDIVQSSNSARWTSSHRSELHNIDAARTSSSKKRTSSKSSAHSQFSPTTGPPPSKKLHHRHRSPRELHSSRSPRRTPTEQNTQGPLFFSDQARNRPPLPYRLSSSEAGARMMSKNNNEDTGGVKTLKLARGSAGMSSPSRPSGQRTPSGSGKSLSVLSGKVKSPGTGEKPSSLSTLTQSGIVELLEQDDRPTFVLDLVDQANLDPGPLRIVFANASLRASPRVFDSVTGIVRLNSPSLALGTAFSDFKSWCTMYLKNHEPLDVALPTLTYAGAVWTSSNLRKRFRVFRGNLLSPKNVTLIPPSLGFASASPMSKENDIASGSQPMEVKAIDEEPQDYFGHVGDTLILQNEDEDGDEAGEIARGLRISKLTQPYDLPVPLAFNLRSGDTPLADRSANKVSARKDQYSMFPNIEQGFFDWTRLADSPTLPRHIQFAKSIDWASTSLGPIEAWSSELRSMCNLIMASPHPAAMYWGSDYIAIYNEAYIYLAGQKHPQLMGQSYMVAWAEIWDSVKDVFARATSTGESTMKEDDCLFIQRAETDGSLEEAWFDWSIIPLVGGDGAVVGLYNPAFEKTKRKVGERRMGTLSSIGEKTSTAKDLKTFWGQVISGLEANLYDAPFVLLYSVNDEIDSDSQSSIAASSSAPPKICVLEGSVGIPSGHPAAASTIDLREENDYFARVFRDAANGDRPIVLSVDKGTLDVKLLEGIEMRGHPEPCRTAVCCPVQSTRNETLGYLVMGINPRRPYDDDYSTFVQMLSRQISTALASVVLFEEEIRAGMRAKRRADVAQLELSEQLAKKTQAVVETERKLTQVAKFAPVGIFMAGSDGVITYRNEKWYEIMKAANDQDAPYQWMEAIQDEDKERVEHLWSDLVENGTPMSTEVRFKSTWIDQNGNKADTWVLASAYPDKDEDGNVREIYGSITDISQQKWAELYEKRRMEAAVEMKRQQENFIDITSHEMRNPLSAILLCADEIINSLSELLPDVLSSDMISEVLLGAIESAKTIGQCAQHQKRIVDDILTLSKLDSALLLVTPCPEQPDVVVRRALKMFESEIRTADIEMNFHVDDSLRKLGIDWLMLDRSRLNQVLINLTTNAIKFTTTQEKRLINVTVSASLDRPPRDGVISYFPPRVEKDDLTEQPEWGDGEQVYMHCAVEDTGRGLNDDEKKLLFLRFSQASPRTHVQYGGSGLGLFISRELVELQGGEIGVSSEAGVGSTFAFYIKTRRTTKPEHDTDHFPSMGVRRPSEQFMDLSMTSNIQASGESSGTNQRSKTGTPRPAATLKILIVEDNLVNQRVLARSLTKLGVTVYVANHGGECLDRLRDSTFWKGNKGGKSSTGDDLIQINVVLMDQEMPIMDGLTCTRAIREMERNGELIGHVPIIAVTANARAEQIDIAKDVGMVSTHGNSAMQDDY